MNHYRIGQVAQEAGVNVDTLRYYERLGLLKPARRTASGYRIYDQASMERLRFIKRAQAFGFTLEEIGRLLSLRPESPRSCNRVFAMVDRKLEELGERIAEMKRFYQQLSCYRSQCSEALEEGAACPDILDVHRS